jgi:hypothetical protein
MVGLDLLWPGLIVTLLSLNGIGHPMADKPKLAAGPQALAPSQSDYLITVHGREHKSRWRRCEMIIG